MILYWGLFYAFMVFVVGIVSVPGSAELLTYTGVTFAALHVIIFSFLMAWFQKLDAKDKE